MVLDPESDAFDQAAIIYDRIAALGAFPTLIAHGVTEANETWSEWNARVLESELVGGDLEHERNLELLQRYVVTVVLGCGIGRTRFGPTDARSDLPPGSMYEDQDD